MTNDCLIPDGKLIVVNFPAGAGGKMIQNCIGLSRHCVLNHPDWSRWHFRQNESVNDYFYQQKLSWVLSTLPLSGQMDRWLEYELREDFLYGMDYMGFRDGQLMPEAFIYKLPDKNLWSTVTVHNYGSSEYYKKYWPNIKHVCLTNCNVFGRKSLAVKNKQLTFDNSWAVSGTTPREICFNFDIDSCIYNTKQFANQVRKLYDYLQFDDFQSELIEEYHSKYIELHK